MTSIPNLTRVDRAEGDDVVILFDRTSSATRSISVTNLINSLPCFDSMSFDNTSRVLTVTLTNGETRTVTIPTS